MTSTGDFYTGSPLDELRRHRERLQRRLQQIATRSAYRTLSSATTRLRRAATDYLHRVAADIVEIAIAHECSLIAVEELTGIQDRLPDIPRFQTWAFRTLIRFVRYTANAQNVGVVLVDPTQTSMGCSRIGCDSVSETNRPELSRFECGSCGYTVHADYNAARNIGVRAARRGHTSSRGRGASQCALKSGSLHPKRGFIPAEEDYG